MSLLHLIYMKGMPLFNDTTDFKAIGKETQFLISDHMKGKSIIFFLELEIYFVGQRRPYQCRDYVLRIRLNRGSVLEYKFEKIWV